MATNRFVGFGSIGVINVKVGNKVLSWDINDTAPLSCFNIEQILPFFGIDPAKGLLRETSVGTVRRNLKFKDEDNNVLDPALSLREQGIHCYPAQAREGIESENLSSQPNPLARTITLFDPDDPNFGDLAKYPEKDTIPFISV